VTDLIKDDSVRIKIDSSGAKKLIASAHDTPAMPPPTIRNEH
jgi:hypothetical protein